MWYFFAGISKYCLGEYFLQWPPYLCAINWNLFLRHLRAAVDICTLIVVVVVVGIFEAHVHVSKERCQEMKRGRERKERGSVLGA